MVAAGLLDLESIRDVARDSPRYAELVIREIIVRPYRIVYRLRPELVEIVTVSKASRLLPDLR